MNLDNYCFWLVIKRESVSMDGNINIKEMVTILDSLTNEEMNKK